MNGAKKMLLGIKPNKKRYLKVLEVLFILLLLSGLFACSKEEKPAESKDYILMINDSVIPKNEMMIYMYQVVEEFQEIGGDEVWEFEDFSGGKSAIDVAKNAIIDNIIRVKVLNEKASELDVKLSDDESVQVKQKAANYLKNMSSDAIDENNITLTLMEELFYEFAIAEKVVERIANAYVPTDEIINLKMLENEEYAKLKTYETMDVLTEYNVSHILLQTRRKDENGNYVSMSDDEKEVKYNMALDIYNRAILEEDFNSLMEEYSEETFEVDSETNGIYKFSKALLPEEFKKGLIGLEVGDVSEVIESESGYHIFKINEILLPTDEEIRNFESNLVLYVENLRRVTIDELKSEAFNELYLKWKESVEVSIDREKWDAFDLQF